MSGDERKDIMGIHDDRRRRARDCILDAIQGDEEVTNRTVLRLLLIVVEEIGDKIDTILSDECSLRETVLNGHSETHHADHDWVKARRIEKCEEVCKWSREQMEAKRQEVKDSKELAMAGKKALIEQITKSVAIGIISALIGAASVLHFLK